VEDLPGFEDGLFLIQDPSTLGCVDLLAPLPGEIVLDACAAPGGKSAALRDRMTDGTLLACDLHEDRLVRLRENATRLKWDRTFIGQADACQPASLEAALKRHHLDAPHAILLDVPCSNTGVLRRRADARWRFSETRLEQLLATQRRMLDAAARLVPPGGRIVYSTCSIETEENEKQKTRFLDMHANFRAAGEFRSRPPTSGMDGAYAVRLERVT
jgi:16S rRNA (cytosine967-C5)-methyltransferase